MDKKEFLPKLKVLELIEDNEIITPMTLVDYLDMSYSGAVKRIYRLRKAGLIEPLGIERGKWILTTKGCDHLDFLKRREKDKPGV